MSEDKPAKRRKIPVEARGGIVMASQTITSVKDSSSKDSLVVSNAPGTSGLLNIKDPKSIYLLILPETLADILGRCALSSKTR